LVKVSRRFQATKKPRERGFFANPRQCAGRKKLSERDPTARDFLNFFQNALLGTADQSSRIHTKPEKETDDGRWFRG